MQIFFGHGAGNRSDAIQHGTIPPHTPPAPLPVFRSNQQDASLFPQASSHSSSTVTASQPQFQADQDSDLPLSPALRQAIRTDDWAAVTAAQDSSPTARVDDLALLRHAAQAGAVKIAFRLQGRHVSPFDPDMKSGAFYTALKHGNDRLAEGLLNSYTVIEQRELPDLRPCLEAAVDDNDSQAISLLVKLAVKGNSVMPFDFLQKAISEPNQRRVEILISHPVFAAALNDPEAERLVLAHAIDKGSPEVLGLMLARKRSPANVKSLWQRIGKSGDTLLHIAAASGNPEKLKLILDFSPDIRREGAGDSFLAKLMRGDQIDMKNNAGKTARALAQDAGHAELVGMLDARGARS